MKYSSLRRNPAAFVAFSVMVILASGCDNNRNDPRHSGEGRVRADRHALSLVPPQGWTRQNAQPNILTFKGPADNGFAANFTVGADRYSGKMPVEGFPEKMRADLPSQFTILDDGFTTIDKKKAYYVRTSVTAQGVKLVNVQYFFPSGRTMYSISFASAEGAFDRHKATLQSVLNSVRAD